MQKPTLILLHGWTGNKTSLAELDMNLSGMGYEVFRLEMPGHGETPQMTRSWGMEDFAKWTVDEIHKLGVENPILVGHSFGGKIILEIASSKLMQLDKFILVDANGIKPKQSVKLMFWRTASKLSGILKKLPLGSKFRELIYKHLIRETDYFNASENLKESFKIFNNEHYDDKLESIDSKALIIWGRNDKVTPLWMGVKLNKGIKNSEFVVLEGTHGVPIKSPVEVSKLIDRFIQE